MIFLALVHYPVLNRKGDTIVSAVTNLDIHDIARVTATYGLDGYYIVTPLEEQQLLVRELARHWTKGTSPNTDRKKALGLVEIAASIDDVCASIAQTSGRVPRVVATSAQMRAPAISWQQLRREIECGAFDKMPLLLLFGTASGLAHEVFESVSATLEPIEPQREYNHLSVRSAVAIAIDRLCGNMNA